MADPDIAGHLGFIVVLLAVGVVGGYVAGLFGIGGGIVLVPAFVAIFPHFGTDHAVLMHSAVGTCLALIVPGALMSARRQRRQGNLDMVVLRSWLPGVAAGVVAGALMVGVMPTTALKVLFVAFLLSATIYSIIERDRPDAEAALPGVAVRNGAGLVIGGLSVMLGIGGGTFAVPFYRFFDYPLKRAIALSSATGLLIGLGGAIGAVVSGWGAPGRAPDSLGYVSMTAFVILAPCMMVFGPLGARSANALPGPVLGRVYTVFLATMTVYMTYQVWRGMQPS